MSAFGLGSFQLLQWLLTPHCVCTANCAHRLLALNSQPCLTITLLAPHCVCAARCVHRLLPFDSQPYLAITLLAPHRVCAARRPRWVALDGIAALPFPRWQRPPGRHQVSFQVCILPSCTDAQTFWRRCMALAS